VILEQAALMAVLAWLVVRLARAGTPLRTALAGSIAVGAGAAYWTQRPLLFGLVCLALTVTAVERRWNPWWLVPIVWVWVNTHGSFPLGLLYLGVRGAGEWLDERRVPSARAIGVFAVGLAAGALNPLGPKLLTFAVTLGDKREVFREVTEWRSPNFQRADGMWTLVFLAAALVVLLRYRVAWRHALPSVAFLLFAASGTTGDLLDLRDYPVAAVKYAEREKLFAAPHRVAHNDIVGDYLVLRHGRDARVFADDRFDMYPVQVSDDLTQLIRGGSGALRALDRWKIDVVIWNADSPLVALLDQTGDWRHVYRKAGWVVLRRAA
jgi:hypothetical protein